MISKVSVTLVLLLYIIRLTTQRYINLGNLLKPVLQPGLDYSGSVDRNNQVSNTSTVSLSLGKKRKIRPFGNLRRNDQIKALQQTVKSQFQTQQNLYKAIGITEDVIIQKVLPAHIFALRQLHLYFPKHRTHKKDLMYSMRLLKNMIQSIFDAYLKNVTAIVIGNNNNLRGSHIYLQGDNHTVMGKQNFIFNPNHPSHQIKGNNIVRIGSFDVDLDLIDRIKTHPQQAITYLQKPK